MTEENTPAQTEPAKELSDLEKLKAQNAEFEKELIKAREMKAEKQKLDAELLLSGTTGGEVKPEVKEVDPVDYSKQALSGEVGNDEQE